MPAAVVTQPTTRFARIMVDAMNKQNMSMTELSLLTTDRKHFKRRINYELLRKVIRGVAHPSDWVIETLCKILGLDEKQMQEVAVQDKVRAKYGSTVQRIVGTDPTVAPFENVIPSLTPKQRETFLVQMQAVARSNR